MYELLRDYKIILLNYTAIYYYLLPISNIYIYVFIGTSIAYLHLPNMYNRECTVPII